MQAGFVREIAARLHYIACNLSVMFFCCPTQKRSQGDVACGKTKVNGSLLPSDWIPQEQADRLLRRPNGARYDVIFPNLWPYAS